MNAQKLRYGTLTDWVDTLSSALLGLTAECARCHEDKSDPLSQHGYFGLQSVFSDSIVVEEPTITAMEIADREQHYLRVVAVEEARKTHQLFKQRASAGTSPPPSKQKSSNSSKRSVGPS